MFHFSPLWFYHVEICLFHSIRVLCQICLIHPFCWISSLISFGLDGRSLRLWASGVSVFAVSTMSLVSFCTDTWMSVDGFSRTEKIIAFSRVLLKRSQSVYLFVRKFFRFFIVIFELNDSNSGMWSGVSSISPSAST